MGSRYTLNIIGLVIRIDVLDRFVFSINVIKDTEVGKPVCEVLVFCCCMMFVSIVGQALHRPQPNEEGKIHILQRSRTLLHIRDYVCTQTMFQEQGARSFPILP